MRALLTLRHLRVENANAVAGLTWGFPAISHFLGFCHALDRKLRGGTDLKPVLGGCAIVCHQHQAHSRQDNYGVHRFCLTRNPLTQKGDTAPFNEEGRMHMDVTLVIEMHMPTDDYFEMTGEDEDDIDLEDDDRFIERVSQIISRMRLAGGAIEHGAQIDICKLDGQSEKRERQMRRLLFQCLPGYGLVDRSELLADHHKILVSNKPDTTQLEAWMDFASLRYRASVADPDKEADWERVTLPQSGWFVPLMVGYQPIAPLCPPGTVDDCRDPAYPLCPVEGVYGVGQWIAPQRVTDINQLMWRYQHDAVTGYQFQNEFQPENAVTEKD